MAVKPIETRAYGHRFRSRLEARWAVFFTQLGLKWQYEAEGFELPDGSCYLPDFLVNTPQGKDLWIEVKPDSVETDDKFSKFSAALTSGPDDDQWGLCARAALVSGTPMDWLRAGHTFCARCGHPHRKTDGVRWDWIGDGWGLDCFPCDAETDCGGGHPFESTGVKGIDWRPHKGSVVLSDSGIERWLSFLRDAAYSAAYARFEHGEAPQ